MRVLHLDQHAKLSAAAVAGNPHAIWQALLLSWAVSICQRFAVIEPALLILSKVWPVRFTS